MQLTSRIYGITEQGQTITRYVMENRNGVRIAFLDYGCILTELWVPDREGKPTDILLGFDDLASYEKSRDAYFGAFIGRYASRIRGSEFTLHGSRYELPANEGPNHRHGTWSHRVFEGSVCGGGVRLTYHSPDGEEGYPGAVDVSVTYALDDNNVFSVKYEAVSDADTIINLTNHSYFNLAGHQSGKIDEHLLQLNAESFLETADDFCPTGQILPVDHTPMDFRRMHRIGRGFPISCEQMELVSGYDHCYVLKENTAPAALVYAPQTGIAMQVATTQPGILFYSGNFLGDGTPVGKSGAHYESRDGFCLETQHYPCAPEFPEFPTTVLKRGELFEQTTLFQFQTIDKI